MGKLVGNSIPTCSSRPSSPVPCSPLPVSATTFKDCGSTATVTGFRVEGCEKAPCSVKRGSVLNIGLDFVANGASSSLQSNLMGSFNGISLPWPGKLPAGCDMLTKGDCPLAAAEEVTLALGLMIESFFPPVRICIVFFFYL